MSRPETPRDTSNVPPGYPMLLLRAPWITRDDAALAIRRELAEQRVVIVERETALLRDDRDYWRSRAEKLIDQGLARHGAITEPTMVQRRPPVTSSAAGALLGMNIREIESARIPPE